MKTQFTSFRKFIRYVGIAAITALLVGCGGGNDARTEAQYRLDYRNTYEDIYKTVCGETTCNAADEAVVAARTASVMNAVRF